MVWVRAFLFSMFIAAFSAAPAAVRADLVLLMAEESGCVWCERWNAEIGEIYHKTAEGRAAPLLRHDVHDPLPAPVTLSRPVHFTPTFILLDEGREINRIEGYPGEDFFWGLLNRMIEQASPQEPKTGTDQT